MSSLNFVEAGWLFITAVTFAHVTKDMGIRTGHTPSRSNYYRKKIRQFSLFIGPLPCPLSNSGHVHTMLCYIFLMFNQFISYSLFGMSCQITKFWYTVKHIPHNMKAIKVIGPPCQREWSSSLLPFTRGHGDFCGSSCGRSNDGSARDIRDKLSYRRIPVSQAFFY